MNKLKKILRIAGLLSAIGMETPKPTIASMNPIFIPRHCDVVKRKRRDAHRERCRRKKH